MGSSLSGSYTIKQKIINLNNSLLDKYFSLLLNTSIRLRDTVCVPIHYVHCVIGLLCNVSKIIITSQVRDGLAHQWICVNFRIVEQRKVGKSY